MLDQRNMMSLQTLCEKEGTTELEKYNYIGKDGKVHIYYSLGSKKVIIASSRAQELIDQGKTALDEGYIEKAKACFKIIRYVEYKKKGLSDKDIHGKSNWVPSLIVVRHEQDSLSKQKRIIKRNEMSYKTFCEQEGSTLLKQFDFVGKDGKKSRFYSLGSKKVIWVSDRVQQAINNRKYEILLYAEQKKEDIPDYDDKGRSNWIPSIIIDSRYDPFYYGGEGLYEKDLNNLHSYSFTNIRNISVRNFINYSEDLKDNLIEEIKRGTSILKTTEQLHAYMYCYGLMHEAKLHRAFREIPPTFFQNQNIEVVDYACGQGIATACFALFIENNKLNISIKKITLIDPSTIALYRASLICHKICPSSLIELINLEFDGISDGQFLSTEITRVHLFSNVLDMCCYNLEHLAVIVSRKINKGDYFICVDPLHHDCDLDGRHQKLMRLLNGKIIYHGEFNSGQFVQNKTWTANITIFRI